MPIQWQTSKTRVLWVLLGYPEDDTLYLPTVICLGADQYCGNIIEKYLPDLAGLTGWMAQTKKQPTRPLVCQLGTA